MAANARRSEIVVLLMLVCGAGCVDPVPADSTPPTGSFEITAIGLAVPVVAGSILAVSVRGSVNEGVVRSLDLSDGSGFEVALTEVHGSEAGVVEFVLSLDAVQSLGTGWHALDAVYVQDGQSSKAFPFELEVAEEMPLSLNEMAPATAYRNDLLVLSGAGFIAPEEGTLVAAVEGVFTPTGRPQTSLAVNLPVTPAERFDRGRGLVRLSTAIGGLNTGVFEGSIRLRSTLLSGATSESPSCTLSLTFLPPDLFDVRPDDPALGQIVTFRGGGFLGHPDEPQEVTLLRFSGSVTEDGGQPAAFGPAEAVLLFSSGQEGRWPIEVEVKPDRLVSAFFGFTQGTFSGTVTPVTVSGVEELSGEPLPLTFRIEGVRQVVVTLFLPGFWDSLRSYGLYAASAQVGDAVLARIQSIWDGYAMQIVSETPADFVENAYAVLEIGGPDPNGLGLMGYENTQGKDINNLRLFDHIGGANAATQADGFPGYGGVFIDSYLYWSEHPPDSDARPQGSPTPDPLFDEIFDAVREQPATLEEAQGMGSTERVEVVTRAISALGNVAGETAAHEIGHSVGLAQPYEPVGHYHSMIPGPGCLMDSGADRPFGERAQLPGFDATRFCYEEPAYLGEILPR